MSIEATITIADRPPEAPLLVSFPQGVPENGKGMKFAVMKKGADKSLKHVVKSSHNSVKFRGTDFGEQSSKRNCHQLAVAVYNAKTHELKLHPCNHAYILRPQATQSTAAPRATLTNANRRENLTNEFGSKKKKRALQAAKSNTIVAENISGAHDLEGNLFADGATGDAKAELIEAAEKIIMKSKKKNNRG